MTTSVLATGTEKMCSRCKLTQPMECFSPRTSWCKRCSAARTAERRVERAARFLREQPTDRCCTQCKLIKPVEDFTPNHWWCRPCNAAYQQRARQIDPDFATRANLRSKYGLTLEQYDEMLAAQGGHCALCPRKAGKQRLHVDHDHRCCPGKKTCGKCIRGILCYPCNSRLGVLESESEHSLRLQAYAGIVIVRTT